MHMLLLPITCALGACALALMEIQLEGPDGWAAKLPTRRFDNRLTRFFWGVPITGYHLALGLTVLVLFHLPIAFAQTWTLRDEFAVLGAYALFFTLEDFLWFVLNPAFGIRKFRPQHIWWHTRWFLGVPAGYWFGILATIFLFVFAAT